MNPRLKQVKYEEEKIIQISKGKEPEYPSLFYKPKRLLKEQAIQEAITEEDKACKYCLVM